MDWARWSAWDNQIHTWIGSHEWIKEPADRKYIEKHRERLQGRNEREWNQSIMEQSNGQRQHIGKTSPKVNVECLGEWRQPIDTRPQCTWYIYRPYPSHEQTKGEMAQSRQRSRNEMGFRNRQLAWYVTGLFRFSSVLRVRVIATTNSLISPDSLYLCRLPLSVRVMNMAGKCTMCTAVWCR